MHDNATQEAAALMFAAAQEECDQLRAEKEAFEDQNELLRGKIIELDARLKRLQKYGARYGQVLR